MLLLAACGSHRQQQPKAAADTQQASHGKIMVGSIPGSSKIVKYVRPVYPTEARKAHVQGIVSLQALIAKTGEVRELQVLSGDPKLVPAAIDAVKQWRYAPIRLNDDPVEIRTVIDVDFTLNQ